MQPERWAGWRVPAAAFALFVWNAYICLRLFSAEFNQHMDSVEGLFIGLTRFTMRNWGDLTWLPLWFMGMPFHHVYPPGIPVTAAGLATVMHWSPAHAWHFLLAFLYSLGPALLFWSAWTLSGRFGAALSAGILWTVLSPSCLLVPAIWHDTGEIISNRRLHNIVAWGEGANAVMLGVAMLAIALLHLALTRGRPIHYLGAVLACAAVPLCSWPAAMALVMAVACYMLSREPGEWKRTIPRLLLIGAFAYALAAGWIPPSTIIATWARTQVMMAPSPPGPARPLAALGLLLLLAALWMVFRRFRLPFWFRFSVFYLAVTGWICLLASWGGPQLLTQSKRFQLAMETGFILTLVFGVGLLIEGRRRTQYVAAALLLLFAIPQTIVARRHARDDLAPIGIQSTLEFQTARWFQQNMHGARVFATGSTSFWMNAFTDTPQLIGCCDQANTSSMNDVASYTIESADQPGDRDVEVRTAWMKAFGVQAIALGGPATRDAYKVINRPESLIAALPVARRDGDDYILTVPARSPPWPTSCAVPTCRRASPKTASTSPPCASMSMPSRTPPTPLSRIAGPTTTPPASTRFLPPARSSASR
jgi:hypothetical protein